MKKMLFFKQKEIEKKMYIPKYFMKEDFLKNIAFKSFSILTQKFASLHSWYFGIDVT